VDAENISYISPRGMPGQVKAVFIKQGDMVKKGQLLLKLDDAIARQAVAAAKQQADAIKTQLALAKDLYTRQKNLYDEGIGTKVDLLKSEAQVNGLQNQLASIGEAVKSAQEQLNTTNVLSDVNGVADVVNIKVGETFSGTTKQVPRLKLLTITTLKL
jgi:RND family efflux transporter MFP subunit